MSSRYILVVAGVVVTFGLQHAVAPEPEVAPFVFFFVVIAFIALTGWFAGRGPALIAVVLSAAVADFFFIPPYRALPSVEEGRAMLFLFVLSASAVAVLCSMFRAASIKLARLRDVAANRAAEAQASAAAMREALSRAEHAVQQRTQSEAQLRDADQRKDEFLAMLSHELRNPLSPIRNSVHVLKRAEPGGEQAHRALGVIDRQVTHMTRLVDDLLDVTRISRGKIQLHREWLDLTDIVSSAGDDLADLFRGRGIDLSVSLPEGALFAFADRTRVAQMVGNLLQNAAKFTPKGGQTWLSLARDDGGALIEVRDDGEGLDPSMVDLVFEPFVQAKQTLERSHGGLGLGLALVKALAELHGGSVTARSDGLGRGAVFQIRLPREAGQSSTDGRPRDER